MSEIKKYTEGSINPFNIFPTLIHKALFARDNPDYFYPAGIWVFCGPQGSGKTLSAVQTVQKICKDYPKAILCTNLEISGVDNQTIEFTDYSQLEKLDNGTNGIIFLIDEIHVLWNSLESKDIPISEMACFCQMRKNRRVIVGTSQVYSRIAKPIREQLQYVIECRNILQLVQWNTVLDPAYSQESDGTINADKVCTRIWFHHPRNYKSYETLTKINKLKRKGENHARISRSASY